LSGITHIDYYGKGMNYILCTLKKKKIIIPGCGTSRMIMTWAMIPQVRGLERGPRGHPFILIHPLHYTVYPPLKYQEKY
jgi:hypothetical protein